MLEQLLKYRKYLLWAPALLYFVLALVIMDDYGVHYDEGLQIERGDRSYRHVFEGDDSYHQYRNRDYGVPFELPTLALSKWLGYSNLGDIVTLRHFCLILVFALFLSTLSHHIYLLTNRLSLSLFGSLLILCCPRIFAHSFFNSKDIFFLVTFFWAFASIWYYAHRVDWKSVTLAAICSGLAINARIIGLELVVVMFAVFTFLGLKHKKFYAIHFILYISIATLSVYLFFPYLWDNPFKIAEVFQNMSKFRWAGTVRYFGEWVSARELPWHYLPVWIGTTVPLLIIVLFLSSAVYFFIALPKLLKKATFFQPKTWVWAISIGISVGTIAVIIINKSVVYDGWRHVFFIYPFMVISIILGIEQLNLKKTHKPVLWLSALLLPVIIQQIANHPYQQTYFNVILQGKNNHQFEGDYWGVGYYNVLKELPPYNKENKAPLNVYGNGWSLQQNVVLLHKKHQQNIYYTDSNFKYYITNLRNEDPQIPLGYMHCDTIKAYGNIIMLNYQYEN